MAKGGGKGKGKKGGKKKKEEDPNLLTEVDKTFYELQITDLNRKLARLRSLQVEYEQKNIELQEQLSKVDEDKSDIIIYLKRVLQDKTDEVQEIQDRLTALEETRENESQEFENKITELEEEYKQMHETLTSEVKLLEGKLNSLEEFRVQKDELMKKYEVLEAQLDEQEKRHKRQLYEAEKKFIIGRDKLKKEMEARLLQLSTQFHDATELRIAATTHRVIRENIAINNELEIMLMTHKKLYTENETMKDRDRSLREKAEVFESTMRQALKKSRIQTKIVDKLTQKNEQVTKQLMEYKSIEKKFLIITRAKEESDLMGERLKQKIKILEQNLHASLCERTTLQTKLIEATQENEYMADIIYESVNSIKTALRLSETCSETSIILARREHLLHTLLELMTRVDEKHHRKASVETVPSDSVMYEKGDLGFVPKPLAVRPLAPTKRHIECQTTASLEILQGKEDSDMKLDTIAGDMLGEEEELLGPYEEPSIIYFTDYESIEEEEVSIGKQDLEDYMDQELIDDAATDVAAKLAAMTASDFTTTVTDVEDTRDTDVPEPELTDSPKDPE